METGALTSYIDVAQVVLYVFWAFFFGLVIYLRREDKREGYPLERDHEDPARRERVRGFPDLPAPKTFYLAHGQGTRTLPHGKLDERPIAARRAAAYPGSPLLPTGNPMLDRVGPASYAERPNKPDLTYKGEPRIVPMRVDSEFSIASQDPDPRGMEVVGADGEVGGVVSDVWVDRAEPQVRYLELEVAGSGASAEAGEAGAAESEEEGGVFGEGGIFGSPTPSPRRVLLPINFTRIDGTRRIVRVASILGHQFADAPVLQNPDQITLQEEDMVCAYYGGGTLYATPDRQEPFL
jgi:photosynthetic reaction center H subunit